MVTGVEWVWCYSIRALIVTKKTNVLLQSQRSAMNDADGLEVDCNQIFGQLFGLKT